jgi:hypothetical protein
MKPQTQTQGETLEAVRKLQNKLGRTVLLREIAAATGHSLSSEWGYVKALTRMGLLLRGSNGRGQGVQIMQENRFYRDGWRDAAQHLQDEIAPLLLQHHASPALIQAVVHAILDTQKAASGSIDATKEGIEAAQRTRPAQPLCPQESQTTRICG